MKNSFYKCGQTTFSHREQNDLHNLYFNSLKVVLYQEPDGWTAHALEVDHFSMGQTEKEAIENFVETLGLTVCAHVDKYGHAQRFLKKSPKEAYEETISAKKKLKIKARITLKKIQDSDFPKEVLFFKAPSSVGKRELAGQTS